MSFFFDLCRCGFELMAYYPMNLRSLYPIDHLKCSKLTSMKVINQFFLLLLLYFYSNFNCGLTGLSKPANKSSPVPRRSPPPPPTTTTAESSRNEGSGGPMGAFWTTQHAKESAVVEELKFDEEASGAERFTLHRTSPPKNEGRHSWSSQKMVQGKSGPSKDFEMNFFPEGGPKSNDGFNAFASEFGMNRVGKEEELEGEVERLREELKQVNMEKNELSSKYEKLSAICRSQRQELHELKQQTLASTTPSSNKSSSSKTQPSPGIQHQSPSPSPQVNFMVVYYV